MKAQRIEKEKHEFALYLKSLSELIEGKRYTDVLVFTDDVLIHRIMNVLRLKGEDTCIFFDRRIQVSVIIVSVSKKQLSVRIDSIKQISPLTPTITFLLPVLKRDDYESALYALTEVGVNTIQLVFTQKTAHHWLSSRDSERAERILVSAAEQSKNFAYPYIKQPISLEAALAEYHQADVKVFFDLQGKKLFDIMSSLQGTNVHHIVLLVGPEGDLHKEEKKIVQDHGFVFCSLTPTVMRAVQAVTLGAGFFRSLF